VFHLVTAQLEDRGHLLLGAEKHKTIAMI